MIYTGVKHQWSDEPIVVLEIDWEGAEYLADICEDEYLRSDDKGAKEIYQTLRAQVEYLHRLKEYEEDTW